mgnify:CR=1 FL=1
MSHILNDVLAKLEPIAAGVIADKAVQTDVDGVFPSHAVEAMASAGLMGLVTPIEHGGLGGTPGDASHVVERIARECGSSAMVICMHFSGAFVLARHGGAEVNRAVAAGQHLSTLAFSEVGSRSHFWAPLSTASSIDLGTQLDAAKSWVTSANHATAYVWSSRPLESEAPSTIWLVPADSEGLKPGPSFDGLGLRGNDSTSIAAENVMVDLSNRLGPDGGGFDIMMGTVLPIFQLMNSACSVGLMEGALSGTVRHASGTRYEHLDGASLADLPTIRNFLARARVQADMARMLWLDACDAVDNEREDAMLRVLQVKAGCGDTALDVLQISMRVCGGSAYRKEVGVERYFRDAQAASIMAPTSDVLYDFIGKAVCGMDLF